MQVREAGRGRERGLWDFSEGKVLLWCKVEFDDVIRVYQAGMAIDREVFADIVLRHRSPVAQLVERTAVNRQVLGSSPSGGVSIGRASPDASGVTARSLGSLPAAAGVQSGEFSRPSSS